MAIGIVFIAMLPIVARDVNITVPGGYSLLEIDFQPISVILFLVSSIKNVLLFVSSTGVSHGIFSPFQNDFSVVNGVLPH